MVDERGRAEPSAREREGAPLARKQQREGVPLARKQPKPKVPTVGHLTAEVLGQRRLIMRKERESFRRKLTRRAKRSLVVGFAPNIWGR